MQCITPLVSALLFREAELIANQGAASGDGGISTPERVRLMGGGLRWDGNGGVIAEFV